MNKISISPIQFPSSFSHVSLKGVVQTNIDLYNINFSLLLTASNQAVTMLKQLFKELSF